MARFDWKPDTTQQRATKKRWLPEGPQNIHVEFQDGQVKHVALTEEVWKDFMEDKTVKMMWAHPQAECLTPAEMMKRSNGEAARDRASLVEA